MADVFISYVEEDSEVATALSDGLERAGYSTWCYERHSLPGASYLAQTRSAIEACGVFLVVISRDSLGSQQIGIEVIRAHETSKRFFPVLRGVSHAEFHARQPEWGQAAGGATSIELRAGGVSEILPRIVRGLEFIHAARTGSGEAPRGRSAPPRGRRRLAVSIAVALVAVIAIALVWSSQRAAPAPRVRGGDGAEMILVPAGEFWMGSEAAEVERFKDECLNCKRWGEAEMPRHRVTLDTFYVDRYEVSTGLFEKFVNATGHRTSAEREGEALVHHKKDGDWQWSRVKGASWRAPGGAGTSAESNHPVVQVSWHDAQAYCAWAGTRLPTEAEWEKAARGTAGRRYPWGDAWDDSRVNGSMTAGGTRPVGSYPTGASPYGVEDMAGNVGEWVADWFHAGYYQQSPDRNPRGPQSGDARVLRGAAWTAASGFLRSSYRYSNPPEYRDSTIGFRCAKGVT